MKNILKYQVGILSIMPMVSFAQSNVTLYGIIDPGINYTTNVQTSKTRGKSQVAMLDGGTGGEQGSRWGMKGAEDLGGGLKTIFTLESGFGANNGTLSQGGAMFGRQAYVGLSNRLGSVTIGRQYDPVADFFGPYVAGTQWGGYMTSHLGDLENALNTRRINNSIKVRSNDYLGFSGEAILSLGGVAGSFSTNMIWGAGGSYARGPLSIGVGYLDIRNPNTSLFGSNPNAGPATSNNLGSFGSATTAQNNPAFAGYASANHMQILGVGTGYRYNELALNLAYSNTRFSNLGSASGPNPLGYTGSAAFNSFEANARYLFTSALQVGVAYDYTRLGGAGGKGGANYNLLSAGVDYFLSKRTDVYTIAVFEKASGTDSLGQPAVAQISGLTPSVTDKQASFRVGIRHKF